MTNQYKKIIHYDTPKKHADLKIRWQNDNIKQSEFFRLLSDLYLSRDDRILEIISQYQRNNSIQNEAKRKKTKNIQKEEKSVKEKFALETGEVESIFDLLEQEHPDL